VPAHGGAQRLVQVVRDLDEAAVAIDDIGLRRPTLDDVFLALTGHAAEASQESGVRRTGVRSQEYAEGTLRLEPGVPSAPLRLATPDS
ncbi:MAG: hypothetical protein ACRDI2_07980, partial [Chloroflexota bacterium]